MRVAAGKVDGTCPIEAGVVAVLTWAGASNFVRGCLGSETAMPIEVRPKELMWLPSAYS